MPNSVCTRAIVHLFLCLICLGCVSSTQNNTQPKESETPKFTTAPTVKIKPTIRAIPTKTAPPSTEVLRVKVTWILVSGDKHFTSRLQARVKVLAVARSASGVRPGASLFVVSRFRDSDAVDNPPPLLGKIYRATLYKSPRGTNVKKEPIYLTTKGLGSFIETKS